MDASLVGKAKVWVTYRRVPRQQDPSLTATTGRRSVMGQPGYIDPASVRCSSRDLGQGLVVLVAARSGVGTDGSALVLKES